MSWRPAGFRSARQLAVEWSDRPVRAGLSLRVTGDGPPQGTPGTDGAGWSQWNHVTMSYRRHDDRSLSGCRSAMSITGWPERRSWSCSTASVRLHLFRP
jgi:hypothetical protein